MIRLDSSSILLTYLDKTEKDYWNFKNNQLKYKEK